MSTNLSFQNPALITGTTEYYSLLFVNKNAYKKVFDLLEVVQRMEQLIAHSDETQLHLTRVNWWQQQLKLMQQQQATLPAIQQLQTEVASGNLNQQLLEQCLAAISEEFFSAEFADSEQLKSWCQRRFGMANMAMAQLLNADIDNIAQFIQHSAETEGYCYLLLNKSAKLYTQSTEQLSAMAEQSWQLALSNLPPSQAEKLLPILIRCSIDLKRVKKFAKVKTPLEAQQIDLLPINKFYLAWRWHRKALALTKNNS